MRNISLTALVLSSLTRSPYMQIPTSRAAHSFTMKASHASHFIAPFLSFSTALPVHLKSSRFSMFLDSPVKADAVHLLRLDLKGNHTNYSKEPELIVEEMAFEDCHTDNDGGAIFVIFKEPVFCNSTSFLRCTAKNKGGAIFCVSPSVNITESCFKDCEAKTGAAVYAPDCEQNLTIERCFIDGAKYDESIIRGIGRDLIFCDSNVSASTGNRGNAYAAAIYLETTRSLAFARIEAHSITSNGCVLYFANVQNDLPLNTTNIIKCSTPALVTINQYNPVIKGFRISGCQCIHIFDVTASTFEVYDVITDQESDSLFTLTAGLEQHFVSDGIQTGVSSVNIHKLDISTQQCWFHSRYLWTQPAIWLKVIVAILLFLVVVGGFATFMTSEYIKINKERENQKEKARKNRVIKNKDDKTADNQPFEKPRLGLVIQDIIANQKAAFGENE